MLPTALLISLHVYEAITVPLYARIIFVLLRNNKKFQSSFWRIFCLLAVLDLVYYVLTLLFYRFPALPLFNAFFASLPPSHGIGCAVAVTFLIIYQQNFLHLLISLNRFTGICFPFRHEKFWQQTLPFWLVSTFLISLGLNFNRLFSVYQYRPLIRADPGQGFGVWPVTDGLFYTDVNLTTVVLVGTCALCCLALNLVTLVLIVRYKRKQSTAVGISYTGANNYALLDRKKEAGLFMITLWTMFTQLIMATFESLIYLLGIGIFFFADSAEQWLYQLYSHMPWAMDVYGLTLPWAALLLRADLRKAVFPRLFKESGNNKNTTVIVINVRTATPKHTSMCK